MYAARRYQEAVGAHDSQDPRGGAEVPLVEQGRDQARVHVLRPPLLTTQQRLELAARWVCVCVCVCAVGAAACGCVRDETREHG
jgi:hypothetical protein